MGLELPTPTSRVPGSTEPARCPVSFAFRSLCSFYHFFSLYRGQCAFPTVTSLPTSQARPTLLFRLLQDRIPFAVVGADREHLVNGRCVLGRKTKWGIIEGQCRDLAENAGEGEGEKPGTSYCLWHLQHLSKGPEWASPQSGNRPGTKSVFTAGKPRASSPTL